MRYKEAAKSVTYVVELKSHPCEWRAPVPYPPSLHRKSTPQQPPRHPSGRTNGKPPQGGRRRRRSTQKAARQG